MCGPCIAMTLAATPFAQIHFSNLRHNNGVPIPKAWDCWRGKLAARHRSIVWRMTRCMCLISQHVAVPVLAADGPNQIPAFPVEWMDSGPIGAWDQVGCKFSEGPLTAGFHELGEWRPTEDSLSQPDGGRLVETWLIQTCGNAQWHIQPCSVWPQALTTKLCCCDNWPMTSKLNEQLERMSVTSFSIRFFRNLNTCFSSGASKLLRIWWLQICKL